jgi:hypothetical protein
MVTIIFALFMISALFVAATPDWKISSSTSPIINIHVKEAYYADLDGDGSEDDVYTQVDLTMSGANRYNLQYWITLTLPSGQEFVFGWIINTGRTTLNIANTLYNTALESGWYHLHIEVVMKTGGVSYTNYEHMFDPPGDADGNTKPWASFSLL